MVEHDYDHAFRLESPEPRAPLHRLGPRVRFEKDVPFGKREIAVCAVQPHLDSGIGGKRKAKRWLTVSMDG
jgi:hypothetical protein